MNRWFEVVPSTALDARLSLAHVPKLAWSLTCQGIRARARQKRKSLSAVLTEAIASVRQMEARREFLARLEPRELATDTEADEIRQQWRG